MDKDKPHFHGHRQRLRQRFMKSGVDGFNDYELVELILTLAIPRVDVKKPAKDLIERFGNLRGYDNPDDYSDGQPIIRMVKILKKKPDCN